MVRSHASYPEFFADNMLPKQAGHVAFFSFISEFKDPKDFPKALYLLQICDVTMYIVVAIVVYRYAGTGVASPALGSSGVLISKIAYGIAIPTVGYPPWQNTRPC